MFNKESKKPVEQSEKDEGVNGSDKEEEKCQAVSLMHRYLEILHYSLLFSAVLK